MSTSQTPKTPRYSFDEIEYMSRFASEGLTPAAARTAGRLVEITALEINSLSGRISDGVTSLRRTLDRVAERIMESDDMTTLGDAPLGALPAEIDQMIAIRTAHRRTLALLTLSDSAPRPGEVIPEGAHYHDASCRHAERYVTLMHMHCTDLSEIREIRDLEIELAPALRAALLAPETS